jgi:hypothetical protein
MVGTTSNRDGFGAWVELTAGAVKQIDQVRANSSFESASDPRVHFGLGSATRVDSISIRWPSGKVDTIAAENADQELVVQEGKGIVARNSPAKPAVRHDKRRVREVPPGHKPM